MKKKKKILDKVLMGAVIGGAIGSVVGATIAPKKEEKPKGFFSKIKRLVTREKKEEEPKKIPHEHV